MASTYCGIPSIIYRKQIREICNPLKKLGITYFSHVNIDKLNRFSVIANNPEFAELYMQKEYYKCDIHTADSGQFGHFIVWDAIPRYGKTSEMGEDARDLGILHTFTIVEKNNNGTNYYHFSTHIDNGSMNQVYLSNLELLKLFINYFKRKAKEFNIISYLNEKTEIINPEGFIIQTNPNFLTETDREEFMESLDSNATRKQLINLLPLNHQSLTKRENQVIQLLIKGGTARSIGENLYIAERTAEHHIENIKRKIGAKNKSELIEKAINHWAQF